MNLKKFKIATDWCATDWGTPENEIEEAGRVIVSETKEIYLDIDRILWITEGDHEKLTEIVIEEGCRFEVLGNVEEIIKDYNLKKE